MQQKCFGSHPGGFPRVEIKKIDDRFAGASVMLGRIGALAVVAGGLGAGNEVRSLDVCANAGVGKRSFKANRLLLVEVGGDLDGDEGSAKSEP